MKKKEKKYIKLGIILMLMAIMVCGCTTQAITKSFGGSMELHLESGTEPKTGRDNLERRQPLVSHKTDDRQ